METYKALYYPYIHFQNDEWVKLAALYWDEIGRIVPDSYKDQMEDSETVQALGSVIYSYPPQWALSEFATLFVDFIKRYKTLLQARYSLDQKAKWPPVPKSEQPPAAGGPSGIDDRLAYVYYEKLDKNVYDAFVDSNLGRPDAPELPWVGMHPKLAHVYMTALAEELSRTRGLRPLTASSRDHVAVSGLTMERLAQLLLRDVPIVDEKPTKSEVEATLVTIALRTVVPKDLATLSVDKILEFRDKYPNERANLQAAAAKFAESSTWLTELAPSVLQDQLRELFKKSWAPKIEELHEKLSSLGMDCVYGSFSLSAAVPSGLLAIGTAFTSVLQPVLAAAAGLAWNAVGLLRDKRKAAHEAIGASEVSYLYRIEHDLQPQNLLTRVGNKVRDITLGI